MDDLVIQQARICDGTGTASFIGTLGVTEGRITYLGPDTGRAAKRIIKADQSVESVGEVLTMQLGPREILLVADVRFRRGIAIEQAEQSIERLQEDIRARHRAISRICVHPGRAALLRATRLSQPKQRNAL